MMVQIGLQRKEESAAASNKCTVCWMTEVRAVFVKVETPESRDPIDYDRAACKIERPA